MLLGNLPEIRRDPLAFLSASSPSMATSCASGSPRFEAFVLNHPDDIEQVLVTHQRRFVKGRTLETCAAPVRERTVDERRRAAQPPAPARSARLPPSAARSDMPTR